MFKMHFFSGVLCTSFFVMFLLCFNGVCNIVFLSKFLLISCKIYARRLLQNYVSKPITFLSSIQNTMFTIILALIYRVSLINMCSCTWQRFTTIVLSFFSGPQGSWSVHVCCLHLKMVYRSCASRCFLVQAILPEGFSFHQFHIKKTRLPPRHVCRGLLSSHL